MNNEKYFSEYVSSLVHIMSLLNKKVFDFEFFSKNHVNVAKKTCYDELQLVKSEIGNEKLYPLSILDNFLGKKNIDRELIENIYASYLSVQKVLYDLLDKRDNFATGSIFRENLDIFFIESLPFFEKMDDLQDKMKKVEPVDHSRLVGYANGAFFPVPNIHSHMFDPSLMVENIGAYDSFYLASLLNDISSFNCSSATNRILFFLKQSDLSLSKITQFYYNSFLEMKFNEILRIHPDHISIKSNTAYNNLQNQCENIINSFKNDETMSSFDNSMRSLHENLFSLSHLLNGYIEKCNRNFVSFPSTICRINLIDSEMRSYTFIRNVLAKISDFPIDKVIDPVSQYIIFREQIYDLLTNIYNNGPSQEKNQELESQLDSMNRNFENIKGAIKFSREISQLAESKIQKLMLKDNQLVKNNQYDEEALIAIRRKVYDYSRKVMQDVEETNNRYECLYELIMKAIDLFYQVPKSLDFIQLIEETQDMSHYEWLLSIQSSQQLIIDNLSTELDKIRSSIQENVEKNRILEQEVSIDAPTINSDSRDPIFCELRTLVSCPICEREATHCILECGHIICGECAKNIKKKKPFSCPACETLISAQDIVQINW